MLQFEVALREADCFVRDIKGLFLCSSRRRFACGEANRFDASSSSSSSSSDANRNESAEGTLLALIGFATSTHWHSMRRRAAHKAARQRYYHWREQLVDRRRVSWRICRDRLERKRNGTERNEMNDRSSRVEHKCQHRVLFVFGRARKTFIATAAAATSASLLFRLSIARLTHFRSA